MESLEEALKFVVYKEDGPTVDRNIDTMEEIIDHLQQHELFDFYEHFALDSLRSDLQARIIPRFREEVLSGGTTRLLEAVKELHRSLKWYFQLVPAWPDPEKFATKIRDLFVACLHWVLDLKVKDVLAEFYAHAFQVTTWISEQRAKEEMSMDDQGEEEYTDDYIVLEWKNKTTRMQKSNCEDFLQNEFLPLASHYLFDLDLISTVIERPISTVLSFEIKRYVETTCKGEYEKCWLNTHLKNWIETEVMEWLEHVFGKAWSMQDPSPEFNYGLRRSNAQDHEMESLGHNQEQWSQKLHFILYETFTEMRISEMFYIITDLPESKPAIEDLKLCLERTNQRPYLIKTLRKDLSNRVLHPGVCTSDIITIYIGAVKALRLLDPSGVVMEIVLEPFNEYLTGREDAVRMIMKELLDDALDGTDLAQELARGVKENEEDGHLHIQKHKNFYMEAVTKHPEDWMPDPREADPGMYFGHWS